MRLIASELKFGNKEYGSKGKRCSDDIPLHSGTASTLAVVRCGKHLPGILEHIMAWIRPKVERYIEKGINCLRNLYTVHQQQLCCYSFLAIPLTRTELIERVGLRSLSSIEKQTSTETMNGWGELC
jgi:hypothetical protein